MRQEFDPEAILDDLNRPRQKKCNDSGHPNNYGFTLAELCNNNNMFICYGRLGEDTIEGRTTCKDTSTIGYIISFCPMLSDVHIAELVMI